MREPSPACFPQKHKPFIDALYPLLIHIIDRKQPANRPGRLTPTAETKSLRINQMLRNTKLCLHFIVCEHLECTLSFYLTTADYFTRIENC